jgi:putative tryptophan/tyrosine transport system substrate-binding protein
MNRRRFFQVMGANFAAAPLIAAASSSGKVARIGFLSPGSVTESRMRPNVDAFRQGLRELGYVEGRSIAIDFRWAEGKYERLPALAAELARLNVDVIVAMTVPAVKAAQEATRTIPIIMAAVVDPVATGLVANLARPGQNVTGLTMMTPELTGKQLALLKEIIPKLSRAALLWNPANPGNAPQLRAAREAARVLGVRLQPFEARGPSAIDAAFGAMNRERAEGLIVLVDSMLSGHGKHIVDLAENHHLPAVYGLPDLAKAGGLIAYGVDAPALFRRTATYVDKILKGAKPADLPVEQPTKFELVINLKTAKALGLTIPPSILLRADQIIE